MKEDRLFKIKKGLIKLILALPIARNAIFYRENHGIFHSEKAMIGKLQKIGHAIDLKMQDKDKSFKAEIDEFNYILGKLAKQHVAVDEAVLWGISFVTLAKFGITIQESNTYIPTTELPNSKTGAGGNIPLMNAIVNRRSIRSYTREPVDEKDIYNIIDIAKWAPTSCNRQLWRVKIINNEKDINFVSNYFSSVFCKEAPLLMLILINTMLYGNSERHFAYLDGGAFIQNVLLLLHSKGYGACWMGFTGWDSMSNIFVAKETYDKFYEYFQFDKSEVPISMIAIGHPKIVPKPPSRQSLSNIIK